MTEGCPLRDAKIYCSPNNTDPPPPPTDPEEDGQTFPDRTVLAIDKRVFDKTYLFSHLLVPVLNVTLRPRESFTEVSVDGSYNVFE